MIINRGARIALVVLEILMGLAAVGGGLALVVTNGQVIEMPVELLEGSPFRSYFIPGLVLLVVGITNLASSAAVAASTAVSGVGGAVGGYRDGSCAQGTTWSWERVRASSGDPRRGPARPRRSLVIEVGKVCKFSHDGNSAHTWVCVACHLSVNR
jgi:hypothetical protein